MTQNNTDLLDLLNQTQSDDFFKEILKATLQKIMELDISNQINAGLRERSAERQTYRNRYRNRGLNTRAGLIDLNIPKPRQGNYFPSFLTHYQRTEKSLLSVIQESYVQGISKSQVSEICQSIKDEVDAFFSAPLTGKWPYLYLDASYIKVRCGNRVVSKAVITAIGINAQGIRLTAFPAAHWDKIPSNNPIERLNREIKRRTNCVCIFPNDEAALRLIGAVLIHWDEEWMDSRPYLAQESNG